MIKFFKILFGYDKPVVVWEKFYYLEVLCGEAMFRYTIYHYPISDTYRLEMDPWRIKPLYISYKAKNMPMYVEAMRKLRELEHGSK